MTSLYISRNYRGPVSVSVALQVSLYLLIGCSTTSNPRPELIAVSPEVISTKGEQVQIRGRNLFHAIAVDLSSSKSPVINDAWRVSIDKDMLPLKAVKWINTEELSVAIPAGLTPGVKDVTAVSPAGIPATLKKGLTVLDAAKLSLTIESAPDGKGEEIGDKELISGQTIKLYAVARQASKIIAVKDVSWKIKGASGAISGESGSSVVFTAKSLGVSTVTAAHRLYGSDTTGNISVYECVGDSDCPKDPCSSVIQCLNHACVASKADKDGDGDGHVDGECEGGDDCDDSNPNAWVSCSTCADQDKDGHYKKCDSYSGIKGPDCDDSNPNAWVSCSACADKDKDGSYKLCDDYSGINGPDCDDYNKNTWVSCDTCVDNDKDGYYKLCDSYSGIKGPDCDDSNPNAWVSCSTCADQDKDGYYKNCDSYFGINGPDCNDASSKTFPGAAPKDSASACMKDVDGDGYGDKSPPSGVMAGTDCADTPGSDPACHNLDGAKCNPGLAGSDLCDGADNDCDGATDENAEYTWYEDADGDGYGDPGVAKTACAKPDGYVADHTDCADTPGSDPACNNLDGSRCNPGLAGSDMCDGANNDCDGATDENPDITFYADADGDGFGNASAAKKACSQPSGYVADHTDCADTPGADPACNNLDGSRCNPGLAGSDLCDGADNDCDGVTDNPDQVCDLPNATADCEHGQCVILQCEPPYSDCDGDPANGCESTGKDCFPYTISNVDASQWSFSNSPTWNCNASGTTTVDSSAGTATSTSCELGTLDISNGTSNAGVPQLDTSGPNVMVIRLKELTISNSHVLKLTGDKPIIILVQGNVVVDSDGNIDAGASSTTAGPGGSIAAQCTGQTGGNGKVGNDGGGGGGGGFGTAGGRGGRESGVSGYEGSAGAVSSDTDLQPLRGGCSGGLGGGSSNSAGGAGGGAVQISASGTITIGTGSNAANVSSNGGGGKGQPNNSGCVGDGGDGGGSGGGILLEATAVNFGANGAARAHGGGGGGGTECGSSSAGQDGHQTDDTQASGGAGEGNGGMAGGGGKGGLCAGANCATSAAGAQGADHAVSAGGGGGGGGGRAVILVH